jgi:predicted GTPase
MLASVLNSDRAIAASIQVVNAFVRLRHVMDANRELARKVEELAAKVGDHGKALAIIFQELDLLTQGTDPEPPRERIGFKPNKKRGTSGKGRPP